MDIEFKKPKKLFRLCDLNTGDVFTLVNTNRIFMVVEDNRVIDLNNNVLDSFPYDDTEVVLLKAKLILE